MDRLNPDSTQTRCSETEDFDSKVVGRNVGLNLFGPGEEKFNHLKLNRSIESVCLIWQHPSLTDQWEVAEGLIDQSVENSGVLVRNKFSLSRTLNDDSLLVTSENVDESETFSIHSADQESTNSHSSFTGINDQIWSDINAETPASMTLLQLKERHMSDDDEHFARILDIEFLSRWNIGPQLTLKQGLMFQRYLKQFRDIYAFKGEPLGKVTVWRHRIPTESQPINQMCYSKGVEEHLRRLIILARKCLKYGLKMSAEKCTFGFPHISYLGHIISERGISPDIERHQALLKKPEPNNLPERESFLEFMVYWRTYVPKFSVVAEPLYRKLRGKRHTRAFIWGREQREAYKTLVDYILSGPILVHFDPTAELELRCDASHEGVGALLIQIKNKISGILCCASRTLIECETNYSITKKEC